MDYRWNVAKDFGMLKPPGKVEICVRFKYKYVYLYNNMKKYKCINAMFFKRIKMSSMPPPQLRRIIRL